MEATADGKPPLKSKVVLLYGSILQAENASALNRSFWEEFLLLKQNKAELESQINDIPMQTLLEKKANVNTLVHKCIHFIQLEQNIRTANALEILGTLIRTAVKKDNDGFTFIVMDLLFGFDCLKELLQALISRISELLAKDCSVALRSTVLNFLLVLSTVTDNLSENVLLEFLMLHCVFESLVQILENPVSRQNHGREAVTLLTLFMNYKKYENNNPYIVKLSILDSELALSGYGHVISVDISQKNKAFEAQLSDSKLGGVWSSLSSMFSRAFQQQRQTGLDDEEMKEVMLLALYEIVHLNRNFIITLTSVLAEINGSSTTGQEAALNDEDHLKEDAYDLGSNLIVSFLSYTSLVFLNFKDERNLNIARLCAIILTCITEDQYSNALMHDVSMSFKVPLFPTPMRHRPHLTRQSPQARPLACSVLDLCVEFMSTHLCKAFPFDLYLRILGIVHRLLCFDKKCRVRLDYEWQNLWNCLFIVLKFIVKNQKYLLSLGNVFDLCQKVVIILNIFVTFGDTFLPYPWLYDNLYYEILRNSSSLEEVDAATLSYVNSGGGYSDSAQKFLAAFANIRGIIRHFLPKIREISGDESQALTEDQVLDVVRKNYESLTLKLQDNLDVYQRYAEKPAEMSFFINLSKSVVKSTRSEAEKFRLNYDLLLKELTTIS